MEAITPEILQEIQEFYTQIEGLNPGIRTEISIMDNTKGQNKRMHFLGVKAPYYLSLIHI